MTEGSLFQSGAFILHAGIDSPWKIDCDALTDGDLDTLAKLVATRIRYGLATGVPQGGTRFAQALNQYRLPGDEKPLLIANDVLTTGSSMYDYRERFREEFPDDDDVRGIVIVARGPCPSWVTSIFHLSPCFRAGS